MIRQVGSTAAGNHSLDQPGLLGGRDQRRGCPGAGSKISDLQAARILRPYKK